MNAHLELELAEDLEASVLSNLPNLSDTIASPRPSPHIGKYELLGLLGKGAMGAVHRALDPALEREVALKVMLPRIADDPEHKRRFEREARAVARMSHPNVVTVFDLGYHTDGSPYIVMELLKGRDLLQTLRAKPALSLERKLSIVLQVLEGLGQAHRAGIVHRDIKPANIFISENGTAKVMDFGVAHIPAASGVTGGIVVGTANYMSPEQVLGGRIDGRSDLWSVGCMLGEMLTGRPPFEAETVMSTLYRVAHQEPHLPLPEGPSSGRLLAILRRALTKAPDARYATAEDLATDIRACLSPAQDGPKRASLDSPRPVFVRAPDLAAPPAVPGDPQRPADPTGICKRLREAHLGGKSGHLHFSHASEHRSLRLLQGRIVHGTSDVAGEHLGDVLVRYGHLTQANLERAVAVVLGEKKRLGTVLSEMGLIGPPALAAAVGEHVTRDPVQRARAAGRQPCLRRAPGHAARGRPDLRADHRRSDPGGDPPRQRPRPDRARPWRHEPHPGARERSTPPDAEGDAHAHRRVRPLANRRDALGAGDAEPRPRVPGGRRAQPLRIALHGPRGLQGPTHRATDSGQTVAPASGQRVRYREQPGRGGFDCARLRVHEGHDSLCGADRGRPATR